MMLQGTGRGAGRRPRGCTRKGSSARPCSNERGASLIAVMAMISVVLLIGVALFTMSTSESDLVEWSIDGAEAFYLAEGGVERFLTTADELAQRTPPIYPEDGSVENQILGSGEYDVVWTKTGSPDPWFTRYEIVSTGDVDGVLRQVRATVRMEPFSQYLFFVEDENWWYPLWFTSSDSLDGRVHTNGYLRIGGDPWFGKKVTAANEPMIEWPFSPNYPTFEEGYELGVAEIGLPSHSSIAAGLQALAGEDGVSFPGLPGRGYLATYEVELGRNGILGYVSYRSYEYDGSGSRWSSSNYDWSDWADIDLSVLTNGVVWFEDRVQVEGTLDGELTIGCADDMYIMDDVVYADATPEGGPHAGCNDLMGLISSEDVFIADTAANDNDCVIHGAIMALGSYLRVQNLLFGGRRGDLIVHGSIAVHKARRVSYFEYLGWLLAGYAKRYHYDGRLASFPPPGFPQTGSYYVSEWAEETVTGS